MSNITIFKSLFNTNQSYHHIDIDVALKRIKIGKNKELINKIRHEKDKEDRNKLKTKLPCILFAGEFTHRSKKGLDNHSGFMVVDYDGYENKQKLKEHFEELKQNKYFYSLFVSPSGNGIKGVVKIPVCKSDEHEKYFKQFEQDFKSKYFDASNCDVSRVCYESYDKNIYINKECDTYNPEIKDFGYNVKERIALIPVTDEDVIVNRIFSWNWQKDFVEGQRNSYLFDLAGAFCEFGVSETNAVGYLQNNVAHSGFSFNELKHAVNSAYKRRNFNSKYFEDYNKIESVKKDLKLGRDVVKTKHNIDDSVIDKIEDDIANPIFWNISDRGKITIIPRSFKLFLESKGYKKHYTKGSDKPTFVKVISNMVELTSPNKIKDFVLNHLVSVEEFDVWNYVANYNNLFSEQYLNMIDSIDLIMLQDTSEKVFIAFQNGVLEITKNNINLVQYVDFEYYIWRTHVIPCKWKDINKYNNDYKNFIYNISNKTPLALETAVGYMCSTFKNRSNNKAIILNDEVISENPEGGTGKGLFVQGISKIRKTHIIDGKTYNDKANYQNQSVSIDDKVLVLDDVPKNFNFENQFSLITEGITIRHLYKDPIKLGVQESPKLLISTNYAIRGGGNSHERRRHELEISQYYNSNKTPADEFGRQLFDDWDDKEYLRFYNYMVKDCIQSFLSEGLVKQNTKNLTIRKFIVDTSNEFYDWITEESNYKVNERLVKSDFYDRFVDNFDDYKRYSWFTKKRFSNWLKKYADYKGYEFDSDSSNGLRWFMFKSDKEINLDEEIPF